MLKDIMERMESRRKNIQFYWIRGHCGVEVNEMADTKAKQTMKER
jgi:ribonuclease HI